LVGSVLAVVDTGPLVAAADDDDPQHDAALSALQRPGLRLVIPAMVVAEATYLVAKALGSGAEGRFLAGMVDFDVEAPAPNDWSRIADLVETYRSFPLGGTDASIVALAERLRTDLLITLDRRHFAAIRPRHVPAFRLIPE